MEIRELTTDDDGDENDRDRHCWVWRGGQMTQGCGDKTGLEQ